MSGNPDPLSELRDIHLPDPVSWWPPAPGWWIVVSVVIGFLALSIWGYRRWRKITPYRSAYHSLQGLRESYGANRQGQKLVGGLSILLRRYAMSRYSREEVAGLTGHQWLAFLNKTGNTDLFTNGVGHVLVSVPYGSGESVDGEELLDLAESWLKRHKRRRP